MLINLILIITLVFTFTGCSTTRQTSNMQTQQLQERIAELERELQEKEEQIYALEGNLERNKEIQTQSEETKSYKKTPQNIQTALKNAGFYDGKIDGRIGKNTKKAIREFQKTNNLTADGVVGKKTWEKLKTYLN